MMITRKNVDGVQFKLIKVNGGYEVLRLGKTIGHICKVEKEWRVYETQTNYRTRDDAIRAIYFPRTENA